MKKSLFNSPPSMEYYSRNRRREELQAAKRAPLLLLGSTLYRLPTDPPITWMEETNMEKILRALAPHSILVGSAVHSKNPGDIDLVVSAKGLETARKVLPGPLSSVMIGNLSTDSTRIPIETFRYWYGPGYRSLSRSADLVAVTICGVEFRAWPLPTRDE